MKQTASTARTDRSESAEPPRLSEHFAVGEVYLFHRTDSSCDPGSALWGVVDERTGSTVHLASSSSDLRRFDVRHPLPEGFRFCRRATRAELRDCTAAPAACQTRRMIRCERAAGEAERRAHPGRGRRHGPNGPSGGAGPHP